ncbi:MAG TPA: PHP domain-containing protein [Candidatus Lokiarchaeia archaeon]|nr:PHP domain-containing protein [Candidatus Lokiarchaeia archaeon]
MVAPSSLVRAMVKLSSLPRCWKEIEGMITGYTKLREQFHLYDLHVHTPFSDSQFPIDYVIEGLIDHGIKIVGFTDHLNQFAIYHNPKRFGKDRRFVYCYSAGFQRYRKKFFQIYNKKYPQIRFLTSAEIDIGPRGQLTIPAGITTEFFDYVLVSKHITFPKDDYMWESGIYAAFAKHKIDILAHPHEAMPKHLTVEKMKRFVLYAKKFNVALELNKNKFNEERFRPVLEYMHEFEVRASIASDFHGFKKDPHEELNWSQHMYEIVEKYDLELLDPRKFLPENRKT